MSSSVIPGCVALCGGGAGSISSSTSSRSDAPTEPVAATNFDGLVHVHKEDHEEADEQRQPRRSASPLAVCTSTTEDSPGLGWELAGTEDEIKRVGRLLVRLSSGRGVLVVSHKEQIFAIDHACYHHGGPLGDGDIEDLDGRACIVCPWHKYYIALDDGEGFIVTGVGGSVMGGSMMMRGPGGPRGMMGGMMGGCSPSGRLPASMSKGPPSKAMAVSKGQKQRVLSVMVERGMVFVQDKPAESMAVSSDNFAMTRFNTTRSLPVTNHSSDTDATTPHAVVSESS